MNRRALIVCALVVHAAAGCGKSAVETPTWVDDVQPILRANCVRCHGVPAIGGAPVTFRLDTFEDTLVNGRLIKGAGTMARFVMARAGYTEPEAMPPNAGLESWQRDTLVNWFKTRPGDRPARGMRTANRPPTVELRTSLAQAVADRSFEVVVDVADADGEQVLGELSLLDATMSDSGIAPIPLRAGRMHASFTTSALPEGDYTLVASAFDCEAAPCPPPPPPLMLGTVRVAHPGGMVSTITLTGPSVDTVIHGGATFTWVVHGPTAGRSIDLIARQGSTQVLLANDLPATDTSFVWTNPAAGAPDHVPFGTSWRVIAVLKDGRNQHESQLAHYIVSDRTTTLRWNATPVEDSIGYFFGSVCSDCHAGTVPDLPLDLGQDDSSHARLYSALIYRRLVQKQEMPPRSSLSPEVISGRTSLPTPAERTRIGDWLLAGTPE